MNSLDSFRLTLMSKGLVSQNAQCPQLLPQTAASGGQTAVAADVRRGRQGASRGTDGAVCRGLWSRLSPGGGMSAEGSGELADLLPLSATALGESEDNQSDRVDLRHGETADQRRPEDQIATISLDLVFHLIQRAQKKWRRINAPHLVTTVMEGMMFGNGIEVKPKKQSAEREAA